MSVAAILEQSPQERTEFAVGLLAERFAALMADDPAAFRARFRKMAASAFAFYRGSAVLFYADIVDEPDPWLNERTGRVWIHGDLHAENYGTYMDSRGRLIFDVNDFDEACVGPFTWDVKRLVASLALLGYQKALSDREIRHMVTTFTRAYVQQMERFANDPDSHGFALRLDTARGPVLAALTRARLRTRTALLERQTVLEGTRRRFARGDHSRPLDDEDRARVLDAFARYLDTIPPGKRLHPSGYTVKDVVARRGVGIGSAGIPSYNLLLEGPTQALENDLLIFMKQAQPAAPSSVLPDERTAGVFLHDGHRTVLSQRALQAHADPLLGYVELEDRGQLVAEVSPYAADLEWDRVDEQDDIQEVLLQLGQATAKIHSVSDAESDQTVVEFCVEEAIHGVLAGRQDEFIADMVSFAERYGQVARRDHGLFLEAFRNQQIPGL